ncbi:Light regulated Lir1 [Corchorus capsularis]|uniref:Light regulated Lir1 n=1 Tax=Corchorus capsularis TaxID=210143 RepID=A0A1R3ISI3_COCAP|nr:Light regulated Lir1 [Corchorus capsularis]
MQAAATLSINAPTLLPKFSPSKIFSAQPLRQGCSVAPRRVSIKATATTYDTSTVDYNSIFSVFPAEACETVGGDACRADMYPEVRLQPEARNVDSAAAAELIDREYLQYNEAKT